MTSAEVWSRSIVPLHVTELAHVEVLPLHGRPAEEQVAGGLHEPLAGHHAATVVGVGAASGVGLEHRGLRLLHLEEQRVEGGTSLQEHDQRPRSPTLPTPHDLAGDVDEVVLVEEVAAVVGERRL